MSIIAFAAGVITGYVAATAINWFIGRFAKIDWDDTDDEDPKPTK
jgi:hypothetical protein